MREYIFEKAKPKKKEKKSLKAVVKAAAVKAIKKAVEPKPKGTTKGLALIKTLGLEKLEYIWCQKILNYPTTVLIITFDSRFPSRYLPIKKVRNLHSFRFGKLKVKNSAAIDLGKYKMSVPVMLKDFEGTAGNGSLIIINDIAGESMHNPKMYEALKGINEFEVIIF